MLPLRDCPGPGRTRQGRLSPQDNRTRLSCLVNVHAKTTLTNLPCRGGGSDRKHGCEWPRLELTLKRQRWNEMQRPRRLCAAAA
jgi:hypothetical protein